jgi:sugar/nucleoside kinase (ribokinase family)
MFLYRGANDFLTVQDWRPLKTSWFYLSSLTGESAEIIPELFSYARAHGIKVAWNPGSDQLQGGYEDLSSYLELTDILTLNRREATSLVLSRNNRTKVNDEKELLAALHEMTGGIVVVTDSENGSYVTDGRTDYYEPKVSAELVESTGAGDAYGSTFVACHLLGYGIKAAMKMAAENAASVISYVGAQKGLMTIEQLRDKIIVGERE